MTPHYLTKGDTICIISPSGNIDPIYIDGAKKVLTDWGLQVTEGAFARAEYGRFAGTPAQRCANLQQALDNPEVKAILCSRGGYGLAQIIDKINFTSFITSPKWLIGFSDITILHNVISGFGIASIHGIMAKNITELQSDAEPLDRLRKILFGELPVYTFPSQALNRTGEAHGKLVGGNLSVLMGMRGSRFDLHYPGSVLFIEDIGEQPYHIDRMMQNLRFSGVLSQLSGLVVGQFADSQEDPLMKQTIEQIILSAAQDYDYPVCFNFPAGHVEHNLPLVMGAFAYMKVTEGAVNLAF